jgi:hypothetical protein
MTARGSQDSITRVVDDQEAEQTAVTKKVSFKLGDQAESPGLSQAKEALKLMAEDVAVATARLDAARAQAPLVELEPTGFDAEGTPSYYRQGPEALSSAHGQRLNSKTTGA